MEGNNIDKDCSALGGLFQAIINDMRTSSPIWEDFTYKATKMHSSLKATLLAISSFLDAFQKVADMATGSRGATKEIGSALTRLCMRHRSIESKLKAFTGCILDTLVSPIQEKQEEWKKVVAQLDKDHAKEYKRARQEIKKAASDTVRLQKKVKKGKGDMQTRLDSAMQDVNDKYLLLEESEKGSIRTALIEERSRYCHFISSLKPFVDNEIGLLTEVTHLQEIIDHLCSHGTEPSTLPPASEQVIMDLKGVDHSVWNFQQTPPSSPSSLGSRKSSMCSINSITSSSSGSTQSHSPSHHNIRNRTVSQQPMVGTQRLMSVSSQDSGFTSQDTLFLRPNTPQSLNIPQTSERDNSSIGTPDVDSTPTTPSSTPSASSTWNNWPNAPNGNQKGDDFRPHTISSAYEKSHHNRPALKPDMFHPPAPQESAEMRQAAASKHGRPHSTTNASPYARPSATINKMQPVLPPLGPKPKPKAVAPPKVPVMPVDQSPLYANAAEIAQIMKKDVEPVIVHSPDSPDSSPPTPSNVSTESAQPVTQSDMLDLQEAIKSLDSCTAALNIEYDSDGEDIHKQMQQNSLELAEAIRELEASTAALECTYDQQSHTSHTSLQCSSGYGTMNSTPSGSEDTIASGEYQLASSEGMDSEKYYTLPRSRDVNTAYRLAFPSKRPASTAGIPTNNNSLSRRSSVNNRPPPPVRRTSSVSGASPAPQRANMSPPKDMHALPQGPVIKQKQAVAKHHEGPYAELALIQQSIQDNKQRQLQQHPPPPSSHPPPPGGAGHHRQHQQQHHYPPPPGGHRHPAPHGHHGQNHGHHGQQHGQQHGQNHGQHMTPGHHPQQHGRHPQHGQHPRHPGPPHHHNQGEGTPRQPHHQGEATPRQQAVNSSPLYAEPNVILEHQSHGHANVVQSLNRKFSASNSQNSQGEEDFPLPPTEEELEEMEQIYSKTPTRAPTQDSLLSELKRRVASENSSDV